MSTTIGTDRGCTVGVACGPRDPVGGALVRLEVFGPGLEGARRFELVSAVAMLTKDEARRVAAALLARCGGAA